MKKILTVATSGTIKILTTWLALASLLGPIFMMGILLKSVDSHFLQFVSFGSQHMMSRLKSISFALSSTDVLLGLPPVTTPISVAVPTNLVEQVRLQN